MHTSLGSIGFVYVLLIKGERTVMVGHRSHSVYRYVYAATVAPVFRIEERIVDVLKTVYDPEIPVNIYDLGLIYKVDVKDDGEVELDMTFTAPSCPAADFILEDVRQKVDSIEGVINTTVNLVFEPVWDQSMMTEEARVELGFE